jgi:hypothetical protein
MVSLAFPILVSLLFFSCATIKPMALNPTATKLDCTKDSVALMAVKVSNQYKPKYQPAVTYAFVWTREKDNRKKYSFKVANPYKTVLGESIEYLISVQLPPGKYKLRELMGTSGSFPIRGTFWVPLYLNFDLEPNKVLYLGRIEAVNRKKISGDELAAGPPIPLIDQAVTGFSGGTFDINISDKYETDMAIFKEQFPSIKSYNAEKMILPQWHKPSKEDRQ